jgi:hypothetical protein
MDGHTAGDTTVLQRLWQNIRLTWRLVFLCRFSAFVVLVFGLGFLLVDQIQDLLMALDSASVLFGRQWLFLYVAVWAAAVSSWYWARVLLSFDFPQAPPLAGFLICVNRQLPRVLGALLFACVAGALLRAALNFGEAPASFWRLMLGAAAIAVQGVLFYIFVLYRRRWMKALDKRLERANGEGGFIGFLRAAIDIYDAPEDQRFANWRELGANTKVMLGLSLLTAAVLFLIVLAHPVGPAAYFGAAAVALTAAANLIPVGSLLVYWSNRLQLPVLSAVIAWAVLASFFNDNHGIRRLADGTAGAVSPDSRLTVAQAYERWRTQAGSTTTGQRRPIIVATAGGGSRAAYWTALVLGRIADECPAFANQLFAISGVSGGSLGAAVFVGLLADHDTGANAPCDPSAGSGGFADAGRAVTSGDFLSPALAGLLYPDLAQRFVPIAFLPDRAGYLERGWEAVWQGARGGDLFAAPFASLWPGDGGDWSKKTRVWPALFLNGTNVETGKRIIASNLKMDGSFHDAYDAFTIVGQDLAVSTAVNMSTRFPYVEPAGTLAPAAGGAVWGHIVDGGYFENFGAATAEEIVEAIGGGDVKPIVIQISSDPDYKGLDPDGKMSDPVPRSLGREIYAPIRTFLNTRSGRGSLAAEALRQRMRTMTGSNDSFIHFRLCAIDHRYTPALGWALSAAAQQEMDGMLPATDGADPCGNGAELRKLMGLLRPSGALAEGTGG